jgi:hypothetical protein
MNRHYKIEVYDDDCECWSAWQSDSALDWQGEPINKAEAEDEVRHLRRKYISRFRVVEDV